MTNTLNCLLCARRARADRGLCDECWADVPDEIRQRISKAADQHGLASEHFESMVLYAVKFLRWKADNL